MELTTVQQYLLSILAAALALLLVLAIVVMVMVIRLVRLLHAIASDAGKVVESAELVGEALARTTGPLGLLHFLHVIVDTATRNQHRRGKRR